MSELIRCVKWGPKGHAKVVEPLGEFSVSSWLTEAEDGDKFVVTIMDLTPGELAAMPEYKGP